MARVGGTECVKFFLLGGEGGGGGEWGGAASGGCSCLTFGTVLATKARG